MSNFSNNVFMNNEQILKQIEEIEAYTLSFKEKHAKVFEQDVNGDFIVFKRDFPSATGTQVNFNIEYSDKLPIELRNEFDDYLKKFSGK